MLVRRCDAANDHLSLREDLESIGLTCGWPFDFEVNGRVHDLFALLFDLTEERRGLGEIDVKYLGPHVNEKVGKALINEIFPFLIVSDPQTGNLRVFDYNRVGRIFEFWLGS